VLLDAPRVQPVSVQQVGERCELFAALDVFREGAENGTRGACAPQFEFSAKTNQPLTKLLREELEKL
jgi:hypothetical protein